MIALACYLEAYSVNQFASIINLCSKIIDNFINHRPDITVKIKDIVLFDCDISSKIGFIVAEQFNFGTTKLINSLYKDLLLIIPFSKNDIINIMNYLTNAIYLYIMVVFIQ